MKVAVIGFGMMGRQISQVFAQGGHEVIATDENRDSLPAGVEEIEKGRYGIRAAVARGKLNQAEATRVLQRIRTTERLEEACENADLVIEAVFEDLSLKRKLFSQIESSSPSTALLASNTSTLSLSRIATPLEKKSRVLGMHFFNPAQATKLVEIIRTDATSSEVVEEALRIVRSIGKTPVVVRDEPGFIANRLGLLLYAEASRLLEDGTANIEDIDTTMKLGYGHPMGPFEVADLVGLDTRLRNLESLYQQTGDPRWIPPRSLREMVNRGYLGDPTKKKGSMGGYYEYFGLKR
jgi:3-hydroxybutyryl-CoA dehydrogenase